VGSEIGLDSLILYARKHDLEFKYIADAYEAAIAVLWLTAGREKTYDWVQRLFKARDHDYLITMTNATEGFQKWAKNTFGIDPDYEIQEFTKDQVTYFIGNVFLGDVFIAEAKALNSKQALLLSARKALTMALEGRIIPEE
jgi:dsRNA-specific ribonuclease